MANIEALDASGGRAPAAGKRDRRLSARLSGVMLLLLSAAAGIGMLVYLSSIDVRPAGLFIAAIAFCLPLGVVAYFVFRPTPPTVPTSVGDYLAAADLEPIRRSYDAVGAPRAVLGPKGRTIYANRPFLDLFRRHAGGGMDAVTAALGGNQEAVGEFARMVKSAAAGVAGRADFELEYDDSGHAWRRFQVVPLSGFPGYVVIRVEDVTRQRDLVDVLRAEQRRFADFLENAPIGFYAADEDGRIVYVNGPLADWLGRTPAAITGALNLQDLVVSARAPAGAAYDPFGGDGSTARGEAVLRRADGSHMTVEITQGLMRYSGGGLRTHCIVRDLTRERAWQRTNEESEEKFERIFEDAPTGVALLDAAGRIRRCNNAFRAMVSAPGGPDVEGETIDGCVDEAGRDAVMERFAEVLKGTRFEAPIDMRPAHRDGLAMAVYMNRVDGGEGLERGVIMHCLDTTERRNLEVQLARSQKMQTVGQLAGGAAHDFNNLLTAMIGFCDLLLLRHPPGEQSFADVMQIKQNANRAADLVRQLLAFSRQQTLKPKVLSITNILTDISHLLHRLVGSTIELRFKHGQDLGQVRCDQGQIEQVIVNLVVNARDAMTDGGTIEIRTGNVSPEMPMRIGAETIPAGDYVLIEVVDEGVGISSENRNRIFEPFFSTKEVGAGTGLGLSTVYSIVKQTDGHVVVDSVVGAGSKFSVYLPRYRHEEGAQVAEAPARAEPPSRHLTGAGTILLVEDEDAVRLFSARALRNKGYTVVETRTGQAALETLQEMDGAVDLLVTDMVMPEMDGTSLVREARALWPTLKVICISGYAEDTFRRKLDSSEDIHFLPKPFSLDQLAGLVKEVVARAGAASVASGRRLSSGARG